MQKLILDYSKWRCGGTGPNVLGEGHTSLYNPQGYMCCLGQFSLQLKPELTPKEIMNQACPDDLNIDIEALVEPTVPGLTTYSDTSLSLRAMSINDDKDTTPQQKIEMLKELFKQEGYEIEVINQPPSTQTIENEATNS